MSRNQNIDWVMVVLGVEDGGVGGVVSVMLCVIICVMVFLVVKVVLRWND